MNNDYFWVFKENAEPQGSSDGFWYDITDGGYIEPSAVLSDVNQIKKLQEAINIVRSFELALKAECLLNEF